MRKDCALSKLTPEQQDQLYDWLCNDTLAVVQKRVAKPSPDGFGVNVHLNTLHRFLQKRRDQDASRDLINLLAAAADSAAGQQSATAIEKIFLDAAAKSFAHRIFEIAATPQSPELVRAVGQAIFQYKELALKSEFLQVARIQQDLAREQLELKKKEFEYNAARAALSVLPHLVAIDKREDIDDESKVWRARDRLFGAPAAPSPDPKPPADPNVSLETQQPAASSTSISPSDSNQPQQPSVPNN